MTAGAYNFMRIYSIDEFKFKRTSGGDLFYVMPSGTSISFVPSYASDNLDGSYRAEIVPHSIYCCSIDVLRLTAGTLLAEFFDGDPSWSLPSNLNVEMHNSIDFESKPEQFSYSAIRWTGYLRPNINMLHTLHVYSIGGVRIWLDHKLVLNHTDIPISNGSTILVHLSPNQAYHLVVEYMRLTLAAAASINLKWSSNSEPMTIIPAKNFHHWTHVAGSPISVSTVAGPVSSISDLSGVVTLVTAGNARMYTPAQSFMSSFISSLCRNNELSSSQFA